MDEKWSERFARLEALFLAKNFQVLVEPVKKSEVVITDRPFIPPAEQSTGATGQKQSSCAASKRDVDKATRPVEAPGAAPMIQLTGQIPVLPAAVDRPEVQPPGPAAQPATSSTRPSGSLPGATAPVEEPAMLSDHPSDRASSIADEGEVSDLGSSQVQIRKYCLMWIKSLLLSKLTGKL